MRKYRLSWHATADLDNWQTVEFESTDDGVAILEAESRLKAIDGATDAELVRQLCEWAMQLSRVELPPSSADAQLRVVGGSEKPPETPAT